MKDQPERNADPPKRKDTQFEDPEAGSLETAIATTQLSSPLEGDKLKSILPTKQSSPHRYFHPTT